MNARHENHRGNVLVTLLLLMPVIAVFSLSMLTGVISQKKMAGNLQHKKISAISAESAIYWKWNLAALLGPVNTNTRDIRTTQLNDTFDQQGSDIDASVTVCYQGETLLPMDIELNADESSNAYLLAQQFFVVSGEATETASGAYSKIVQGGYIIRPATGLPGNDCEQAATAP
jgi:hypothetical protein